MTELLVQKYLRSGKTLEELYTEHGVKSYVCNGKVGLNYDMLEALNSDPLACECRGLILREGSFDIVACPMFRFFNKEQVEVAADIDWNTAVYEEKMDGSMVVVGWDYDQWRCGTRGRPEADGTIDDGDVKFSDLVDCTVHYMLQREDFAHGRITMFDCASNLQSLMQLADKNKTYVFELTSPINRIVCKYNEHTLTLLAVRDNITLQELDPREEVHIFMKFGVKTPKLYVFNNINHMIQVVREWNPEDHEGVVVKDGNFNRIKVKNPSYLAFNKLRDSLSTSLKGCIEVILLGKDDDVIPMMPDMIANRIIALKPVVAKVLKQTQADFDELKDIESMKDYAFAAKERLWPAALFALKRHKTPDLKTFALGGEAPSAKLPSNVGQTMLELCRMLDPETVRSLKL